MDESQSMSDMPDSVSESDNGMVLNKYYITHQVLNIIKWHILIILEPNLAKISINKVKKKQEADIGSNSRNSFNSSDPKSGSDSNSELSSDDEAKNNEHLGESDSLNTR